MPTILITGANRGLGLEFVRQYAAAGWRVLATVRDPMKGKPASEAGAEIYVCDVGDPRQIGRLGEALRGVELDVVLANAGVYGQNQEFGAVDGDGFLEVMRVNALAPLKLAEALVPCLVGRKLFAAVSSKMGSITENSSGGSYAYRASKAALDMVIKTLAIDLAGKGVTVLALSPGWVRTDMGGPSAPLDAATAVSGMRQVMEAVGPADSGSFRHYDGARVEW